MSRLDYQISPGGSLRGEAHLPGDKSISHRALMLAALADGDSELHGLSSGADVISTCNALRALGVSIRMEDDRTIVHGAGRHGLRAPSATLDMGNSGTTTRLLAGILAGQSMEVTLSGDASLNARPMRRIADPLQQMGATVHTSATGTLPMTVIGGALKGMRYQPPVASAQLKSAVLLAGLHAGGMTCVRESPGASRDHTERMLPSFGVPVKIDADSVCVIGPVVPVATTLSVPADVSAAAFLLVAATIVPGSEIFLPGVGINPTRRAVLGILSAMGADIHVQPAAAGGKKDNGEPIADLRVRSVPGLRAVDISPQRASAAIDELPVLMVAAAVAEGRTVLRGAGELRVKESDRLMAIIEGLQALGRPVTPTADGMEVQGGPLCGGVINSHGDHRIAMAFAIAGLFAEAPVRINDCGSVATSFPGFFQLLHRLGADVRECERQ